MMKYYIYIFPFKVEQYQIRGDCFKLDRTRTLFLEVTCLARAKSVTEFHSEAPDPMGAVSSSLGPRSRNCLIALYSKEPALKYGGADVPSSSN
ncbi:hypothetical protein pb186bvf_004794 [Paramecium bursaria]